MSMKLFEKITIIGVGLLGASLAKACRKYNLVEEISGFGRNRENLEKAKSLRIIDRCALFIHLYVAFYLLRVGRGSYVYCDSRYFFNSRLGIWGLGADFEKIG